MTLNRRRFVNSLALLAAAGTGSAHAQKYPDRPIRIVSPFPPGGSADSTARLLVDKLGPRLGQAFIIDNKPGAGGGIGADFVAKAPPDGYTLVIGATGAMSINKSLYKKLPYDPVADFTPIAMVGYSPVLIVAHPTGTASTVAELIAAAKAAPGTIAFASNGNGTVHHLAAELFMQRTGISMVHVPYKGSAPAVQDLVSGRVPYGFLDLTLALPLMAAGRLKGIATTAPKRSGAVPKLPTVAESGLPDFDAVGWFGLFGPRGLSAAVVERISTEVKTVLAEPEFQAATKAIAVDTQWMSPAQLGAYQRSEIEKWAAVIRIAKVEIE